MSLQYLTDHSGRNTAVVIPINEWENMVSKHADLKSLEIDQPVDQNHSPHKYTMAEFAGTLSKEAGEELQKYVQQSRDEWDSRNI